MKRKELEKYLKETKKIRESDSSQEFQSESSSEEKVHFATENLPPIPISSELAELLKIAKQSKEELTGISEENEIPKDCKRFGPLSVKENFKWKGFQFYLDEKEKKLFTKKKEYLIDLKLVSSVRRTKGLWPGFELIRSNDSITFHAESEEEIAGWMTDLENLIKQK